jgi:hypothetical protein
VNAQPVGFGSPHHLGSNHVCVLRKRKDGIKRFAPSVVSGSSHVVTHMMATEGLHGR